MESVGRGTTKMPQFCLQLAGLSVSVASQYSQVEHMCSGYEVPKGASSDIDVRIDPQDIDAERDEGAWSDAYLETLAVYRQIAEALPAFDRMLVHGALLSFQGEGYLFAAPSGTGKSTHALLWKRFLGDAVSIVNGDKPIVRLTGEGDVPVAYGTPWAGKEGWHENASVPLFNGMFRAAERFSFNSFRAGTGWEPWPEGCIIFQYRPDTGRWGYWPAGPVHGAV